jgi:predicted DCC family thiol-disulfide oxidoreductase YuxK
VETGNVPDILFYDGACGLYHGAVRFVVRRDREGSFVYAPLGGETFLAEVSEEKRRALPDSLVLKVDQRGDVQKVQKGDGHEIVRSAAVLHLLARLGGGWRIVGRAMNLVPRRLLDAAYDLVARMRHRLFRKPEAACPVVPVELRGRFLP